MTASITVNDVSYPLNTTEPTLQALLAQLAMTTPGCAIALNGQVILQHQWNMPLLKAGDEILLIQPVAGG